MTNLQATAWLQAVTSLAVDLGLEFELEVAAEYPIATGRLAITSLTENENDLVNFINEGPEHWDYELTTAPQTGVPIVYVGDNS